MSGASRATRILPRGSRPASGGRRSTLGATLERVEPGQVEIALVQSPGILQQHGFIHGGAITAIADSAAGYAR
ncbi:MAG TPA: PaaI family thioesterase [Enterovirga sp.]